MAVSREKPFQFAFVLSKADKRKLEYLAKIWERTKADVLRNLIRSKEKEQRWSMKAEAAARARLECNK